MNPLATYLRFEIVRTFRNPRFLIFSIGLPVVLYLAIAIPQRHDHDLGGTGIAAVVYLLAGIASYALMSSMTSQGIRIANERAIGWNRQLRITPLSALGYLGGKVVAGYVISISALLLITIAMYSIGGRISVVHWLEMAGLLMVGLIPFAALGVLIGQLLSPDNTGPIVGIGTYLIALLGGAYGPLTTHGTFHEICRLLPSWWLTQAGHVVLGQGSSWGGRGWLTVAVWSVVLTRLAMRSYRREAQPV